MPHYLCRVCRRPRPEDKQSGWEIEGLGWICESCVHSFTPRAIRIIVRFNTCSACGVMGTDDDGDRFGQHGDWYCDNCTYMTPEIKG